MPGLSSLCRHNHVEGVNSLRWKWLNWANCLGLVLTAEPDLREAGPEVEALSQESPANSSLLVRPSYRLDVSLRKGTQTEAPSYPVDQ